MKLKERLIEKLVDRRFIIASFALILLFILGYYRGMDVIVTMGVVVASVSAANAFEGKIKRDEPG